ncbi:MAG TPA: cadherin-like domain-containing protein, partial [Acidimicrobiales bacterium]|nr:cadherin-like domain-containing protein [Acidimicrobiales bacterium]
MKFPSLLRTRWGAAGSTTFLSASVAALVVAASLSTGAPVSHLQADDASIWLTDNADGAYAHFNDAIGQMQALVSAPAGFAATYHLDVAQSGSDVLAVDRDRGEMWAIDTTADKVAGQGVVLPGGQHGAVATAAGTVAVLDGTTGKVWAHASGSGLDLSGLGLTGHPTATVAGAHALAVSQNGDVVIAAPAAVVRIARTGNSLAKPVTRPLGLPASDSVAVTTVGGQAVVLDTTAGAVTLPDGRRTAVPGAGQKAVLQQPGPTAADVLVATGTALWSVPLTGAAPTKLATSPGGDPAAPVRLDRCSYAAWSGSPGTYAQSCDGAAPGAAGVPLGPTARNPVFRVNHHRVVLNDASDGAAWDLTARPALSVNNGDWRKVLAAQQQNQQQSAATSDNPADAARQDQKPKAVDEEFKARSGRSTVLHILDADSDPNGDVLSISSLSNAAGTGWATTITPDTETAVIRLDSGVTTPVHFGYTIVDAHGRSASATVTVDPVVGETPPHLRPGAATPAYSVISGGTGHYAVLGDWRDDEGDPISLVDASAPSGSVSATSDGVVTFTAPVVTADTVVTITYRVTDGLSAPVAGTLPITVLGRGDTSARPAIAVADVANVVVGAATQVKPLANDVPGADPLHPTAALALAGPVAGLPQVTVATNMTDGTLTVTASAPGVYALTYQAAFGSAPLASGQILVTARPPVTSVSTPVTLPTSVLLHGQLPVTVDVVANDYDPAGGLLTVTGASAPAGISATVVGGRSLRLAATAASLSGQQVVTYSVTNGVTAPVTGQVIVTWVPAPQPGAPITHTVVAVVRAGNVVDVPVLAAASDPAGEPLTLLPTGTALSPVGVGTVGVDGSLLRYAAPATVTTATDVTATYVVQDTSGYRTSGQLVVTVTPPPGPQHPDQPPTPDALEARVVAGGTITIPVPTSGVDPDGDPVAVTGVVDAPQLGRVLSVQP